jgi:hypothetical protein
MGKNITLIGGNGDGQTTKVAHQIIVALNIAAVAEALVFASKAGADPAKVRQALMGGFASSRTLEVHGKRVIKRSFNPGFRVGLHPKDPGLALAGALALGVALPGTANAAQLMQACAANGLQDQHHSALVRGAGTDGRASGGAGAAALSRAGRRGTGAAQWRRSAKADRRSAMLARKASFSDSSASGVPVPARSAACRAALDRATSVAPMEVAEPISE